MVRLCCTVEDSATIKTFYKEDGQYRLQPENDTMDPISVDRVDILGELAGRQKYIVNADMTLRNFLPGYIINKQERKLQN